MRPIPDFQSAADDAATRQLAVPAARQRSEQTFT